MFIKIYTNIYIFLSIFLFSRDIHTFKYIHQYPVLFRNRETLIPLICFHVEQGSRIFSDRFSAYFNNRARPPTSHLAPYGYDHVGINHSKHFVSEIRRTEFTPIRLNEHGEL